MQRKKTHHKTAVIIQMVIGLLFLSHRSAGQQLQVNDFGYFEKRGRGWGGGGTPLYMTW